MCLSPSLLLSYSTHRFLSLFLFLSVSGLLTHICLHPCLGLVCRSLCHCPAISVIPSLSLACACFLSFLFFLFLSFFLSLYVCLSLLLNTLHLALSRSHLATAYLIHAPQPEFLRIHYQYFAYHDGDYSARVLQFFCVIKFLIILEPVVSGPGLVATTIQRIMMIILVCNRPSNGL